jgi:DNA polymerase-3 subunit epsilon
MNLAKAHQYIRAERNRFRRASEGRAWSVKELPQYYYHRNFCDMLTHVATRYTALMAPEHTKFIRDFEALPFAAQCAYARIAGRKGRVFNIHHLHYSEIQNIPKQFDILHEVNFIKHPENVDFKDYLLSLTKPELVDLMLDRVCETQFKRSWKKARLIDIGLEQIDFDDLTIPDGVIVQSRMQSFHYLLFLYFGRIETSLQSKTLGELGLVRPPQTEPKTVRYSHYEEACSAYFYANALSDLRQGDEQAISTLKERIKDWPCPVDEVTEVKRGKLLQKLGGISERTGDIEQALFYYGLNDNALSNERVIRIRYKRNSERDRDWAQARLEDMIDNPESDEELAFAEDFYARKYNKKKTSIVTDLLRDSETVYLDEAFKNAPERAALQYFKQKGYEAYRAENKPWRVLFGLMFWDEIYGGKPPAGWSLPENLKTGQFYTQHQDAIEVKLAGLERPSQMMVSLLKTFTRHFGVENGLFPWGKHKNLDRIKALILNSPNDALPAMLRLMAQDFQKTKDGFPDLMVIKNGCVSFVEVKAEGDAIRRNQLTRLRQLQSVGYEADILNIKWHIDPEQTYVVVDVETTGGRPGLHRVTEIGAVKIQGGEIIDEWSSLINPQRSIPPNITRITGIDEAMVADAPVFADIADSFADFMGDAIFAAHNVNFDYGFISTEFEMIDRKFRHPKICTCASMRKLYPGYRSYSLKNLCQEFQIDLKSHHRALCDAQAAAELLKMVNDKRLDNQKERLSED